MPMPDRDPVGDAWDVARFWQRYLSDPFSVRGPHENGGSAIVRTFQPGAINVEIVTADGSHMMHELGGGLFGSAMPGKSKYALRIHWPGATHYIEDPYRFGVMLSDEDLRLFSHGSHWNVADVFGAVPRRLEGVRGVGFAVWAPNAQRVSVVGDFNGWDGRRHPMRFRREAGVWELFVPGLNAGTLYKYEVVEAGGSVSVRADPLARQTEQPPATASIVASSATISWTDAPWIKERGTRQRADAPISIYEVHAGSWRRPDASPSGQLSWEGLAQTLIPYVKELGFTHIELMPIMEHPFGGSWGYQPLSQFAPTARYGSPEDFARFVDACHAADIGVILDWVPAHFPNDAHGLAHFDGSALYEHADPREGFHPDWNTHVYNLGRNEVSGFLIASALWWLEHYHVDGLRVDAVASMLYRDYSRKSGAWIPNRYGGRENLEAIDFLRRLNSVVRERFPGALMIAEESTAWPGVTASPSENGLGFDFKWNMGWMHDTLRYLAENPVHRRWHHSDMTFGLLYAFSERFVLPLSHDEVVYGKGSLYEKIPGDVWQKLATLRAYFSFMWTHPGKKLLFMGGEFAATREWNHDSQLDWPLLGNAGHAGVKRLISDLNRLYRTDPSLYVSDADPEGFAWLVSDDESNSVFAYLRKSHGGPPLLVAVNLTPIIRRNYRIGVPETGKWSELLNSDASIYGGSNVGNLGSLSTDAVPGHGFAQSLTLTLPPLAAIVLKPEH
jgi:1,4-alpha-glucan branching enzyme